MSSGNYSVLMSVYIKEQPNYLRQAMESMRCQTVPTDDFVLVCDGPLTDELDAVISEEQEKLGKVLRVLRLPQNSGLGNALNEGLKLCKNELVARMDSDDISRPYRCEKQLELFEFYKKITNLIPALFIAISIKIWNYFTFHLDKKLQRAMLIFSIPLIMNALGWWMNNVSDRYVVTFMCGVAANGIYSISYKIPSILNVLQSIFTQSWQISAIKEYNKDGYQDFYGNMLEVLNVFLCFASIVLIAMSKILAKFLYAKDFYSAWMYVPFLLLSSSVNADSGVLGPILSAKKNSKALASSAIAGALANIALNFLLVFFIGVQGAAVATFISSVIIYVARRVAVGKDIHLRNKFGFLLTWVIGVVQALFMIYIDSYIPQCVCLVVFIVVYWKVLKGNMNKIIRLIRRK